MKIVCQSLSQLDHTPPPFPPLYVSPTVSQSVSQSVCKAVSVKSCWRCIEKRGDLLRAKETHGKQQQQQQQREKSE